MPEPILTNFNGTKVMPPWSNDFNIYFQTYVMYLLYPPYPKDRGMLWFYVKAARRPQWC